MRFQIASWNGNEGKNGSGEWPGSERCGEDSKISELSAVSAKAWNQHSERVYAVH